MDSILGLYTQYSFSTNSSISDVWHGSGQPVALQRHYWAFSSSVLLDRLFLILPLKILLIPLKILLIPLKILLIPLMPRRLQIVLKRRGDATPWYTCVPTILRPVAGIKFEMSSFCAIFLFIFLSLNICYVIYVLLWIQILAHVIWNYLF